jgi:hypothetical protein
MSSPTALLPAKNETTVPATPKSKFETIMTLTPVILTVMATVLAGQSMHEMTHAQYHRSVAGQNQSKVADQWAYFQAKKIRATEMEMTTDRIPVAFKPAKLEPYHLEVCGERLKAALTEAQTRARALDEASGKTSDKRLHDALGRFFKVVGADDRTPEDLQTQFIALLQPEEAKLATKETAEDSVFAYLDFKHMPKARDVTANDEEKRQAVEDKDLKEVAQAIMARKPEKDIADLARHIKIENLEIAIDAAEAQAAEFSKKCEPFSDVLKKLNKSISEQVQVAAECHMAALVAAATKPDDANAKDAAKQFVEADASVQTAAQQLNDLFKSALHDFNQRRYSVEAENNRHTAELYEVQVHHSSMLSDNHLERSKMFSWAMMGTQAGVAIASLALAARRKSLLWLLAAFVGAGALAYSAWVFQSTMVR